MNKVRFTYYDTVNVRLMFNLILENTEIISIIVLLIFLDDKKKNCFSPTCMKISVPRLKLTLE